MLKTFVLGGGINRVVNLDESDVLLETDNNTVSAIVNGDTGDITVKFEGKTIKKKLDEGDSYSTTPKQINGVRSTRESVWFIRSRV